MSILNDLVKSLKKKEFILVIFDIFLLLSPGAVIISIFNPGLFAQVDGFKLCLISLGFTTPLSFLYFLAMSKPYHDKQDNDEMFLYFSLSAMMAGIISYIALGFFLVTNATPTLQTAVILEFIIGVIGYLVIYFDTKLSK